MTYSLYDVMVLLKKMRPSPCPLDIYKMIDLVAPIVVKIINTSLSTGMVPNFYKQAVISPIFKKAQFGPCGAL